MTPPRVLAIGDIHGCAASLRTLIALVAPEADDTIVILGDIVDRGPDTRAVIDQLLELSERCRLIFIRGNHEEMMLGALQGNFFMTMWLENGGQQALDSYGGSAENIPPEHLKFLLSSQSFYETDTEIFVHASLEAGVGLHNQTKTFLRWKHLGGNESPHISGKRVICGHTPQRDGVPLVFPGWVCIDTFAHGGGYLTCLDVGANHCYQAAESGMMREFPLRKCEVR